MTTQTKPRFQARCKLGRWVPLAEVLSWPREEQPDTAVTRWDRKQECEAVVVECAFETEDPQAFEEHMADVHGRKSSARGVWDWKTHARHLPYITRPMWRAPRAKPFNPKDWADVDDVTLEVLDGQDLAAAS